MSSWRHVFVVFRFEDDFFVDDRHGSDPNLFVTIKEVVDTAEEAAAEVARLTALNSTKGSRYFYQSAKYYADGRLRTKSH